MASGKLSPRQKMINMMYLVLTALLALNVSKEVLDAFSIIRGKLNTSAVTADNNANAFMASMKEAINDEVSNQGKRDNVGLIDTLDLITGRTSGIIQEIDNHIAALENLVGIDPETGEIRRFLTGPKGCEVTGLTGEIEKKDEVEANYQYWMGANDQANGGHGNGEGIALRQKMNEYFAYLVEIQKFNTKNSADKAKVQTRVEPETIQGVDGTNKTWEMYHFDGPVIGNVALLEAFKSDIYQEQKKLLDFLNGRIGVEVFVADKVVAVNSPISTIVPAGLAFETRLAVALSSSTQSYTATIQVPKATCGFEEIQVSENFTVRKPSVEITSATVQNLYRSCANDVNIRVPALGDYYNPRVSASQAQVIPAQSNKEQYRIIPTGQKCIVSVSNVLNGATTKVGDVPYNVIEPPKPQVAFGVNGRALQGATPVKKGSRIQVRLVPDAEFAASLPRDARYQISQIEVKAKLSLGAPQTVNRINTNGQDATQPINVSLGSRGNSAPPNTTVYIEIEDIYRVNFEGKKIKDSRFLATEKIGVIVVE